MRDRIAGTGLDSSNVLPVDSHQLAPTQRSAGGNAHHPKTVVVVEVVVVVAIRGTAIPGIVVPRATAFCHACPIPIIFCILDFRFWIYLNGKKPNNQRFFSAIGMCLHV
jgi:hypothetical protein